MRVYGIFIILFATLGFSCESCIRLNNISHWLIERAISDRNKTAFRAKFEYLGLICLGKNPAFVRTALGDPRSVDKRITIEGFPSAAATADRNWLYEEEAQCYVVSFQNKKCIAIEPYSYTRDARWQRKRAKLIAHWCIGKDRTFVLTVLGEPRSVDGPIRIKHFPLAAATADRNWLYEYNTACYAVSFKAKKCVAIEPYRFASDQRWQERRGKLISHWCIGKSLAQVFEGLGRTKCKLNSIPRRSKATGGIAWEQDCHYEVGGNIGVYIKFEEGHCVEAGPMHIFH